MKPLFVQEQKTLTHVPPVGSNVTNRAGSDPMMSHASTEASELFEALIYFMFVTNRVVLIRLLQNN